MIHDPILFAGGDTDLYGYCLNDPINFIDPFGLDEAFNRSMKTNLDGAAKVGLIQGMVEHFFWHTVPVELPKACKAFRKKAKEHSDLINNLPDNYKPLDRYMPPSKGK